MMFSGMLYLALAALCQIRERRSGRVAHMTSTGGMVHATHLLPYNGAKCAAVDLQEALRAELGEKGFVYLLWFMDGCV